MKKLYIAYGSNMNLEQMQQRCPKATKVCKLMLKGHRLIFLGPDGMAVATIEAHRGGMVPIVVWEIEPSDEDALDRYEGFPYLYSKKTIRLKIGFEWCELMAYVMNPGRRPGRPGPRYYQTIKEGYCTAGFDPRYLEESVRRSTESY